jgi:hypothetical protein
MDVANITICAWYFDLCQSQWVAFSAPVFLLPIFVVSAPTLMRSFVQENPKLKERKERSWSTASARGRAAVYKLPATRLQWKPEQTQAKRMHEHFNMYAVAVA